MGTPFADITDMILLFLRLISSVIPYGIASTILLHVGEQKTIHSESPILRFSLGNPLLVRSLPHPGAKTLLLRGLKAGQTDLILWTRNPDRSSHSEHLQLSVSSYGATGLAPDLLAQASRLEEVEVHLKPGGKMVLQGEIRSIGEARRLALLEHASVTQHTYLSEPLLKQADASLKHILADFGLSNQLKVEIRGGLIWIVGSIDRPSRLPAILGRLKAAFPWFATEISTLSSHSRMAYLRLMLMEVRKESFSQLGLSTALTQTPVLRLTAGQIATPIDFQVLLSAAQTRGEARILSHPQMVLSVPGDAEFFSGGELPLRQDNQFHVQTKWKRFGLLFKIRALERTDSQLRLKLDAEISHLDPSVATGSGDGSHPPGIRSHRMHTQVDATWDQPLFLSGLLQESQHQAARGLPELADLPGIGLLFGSRDFQESRSELVAVLTTHQNPPSEPGTLLGRRDPGGVLPPPLPDELRRSPVDRLKLLTHPDYPWVVFR